MSSTIDFATTPSGDIFFEDGTKNNKLKLSFNIVNSNVYPPLRLSFSHLYSNASNRLPDGALKLSLDYTDISNTYKASCITDDNVTMKRIEYAIKTTLTDLKENDDFGSDLELYMHSNIKDAKMIVAIENTIYKAIKNILSNPTVKIKPVARLDYNGYHQGIEIDIYNYNELFMTYNI